MSVKVVNGDLLDQPVEAIVNPWNQNVIPWWLLMPHGVSGAIKRRAGLAPFRELRRAGRLALGQAVATGAGKLPFRAIVHVATVDLRWRSSEAIVREGTRNAVEVAQSLQCSSLALPILGAGSGGLEVGRAEAVVLDI